MKYMIAALALVSFSSSVFAKDDCTNSTAIKKAAIAQAKQANGAKSASVNSITYSRTTNDGKQDKYSVLVTVNGDCDATVYVYTDVNTCDVNSAAGGEYSGDTCG